MAATVSGRRLTEAHRLSQARLGARTVELLRGVWPLLDVEAVDATAGRWLRAAVPVVQAQNIASSRLSAAYIQAFRAAELGSEAPAYRPELAPVVPAPQVSTSLTVTGPVAVKQATARGMQPDEATIFGMSRSSAAALRLALLGGRETTSLAVRNDPAALGWARATSGRPCSFCAMLASRGPVYSKDTVAFQAHDSCSCQHEPVYRRDGEWPPGSREFRDLWDESTRGLSGDEARNAFRQALGHEHDGG